MMGACQQMLFPNLNKAQRTSPNSIREVKAEYSAYLDLKVTDPPPLPIKAGQRTGRVL